MADVPEEFSERPAGDPADTFLLPEEPTGDVARQHRAIERRRLPTYGDPGTQQLQFAEGYARLASVALARAEFYGELLAEAVADEGIGALVGTKKAAVLVSRGSGEGRYEEVELADLSEEVRGLVALEWGERDRAAQLIKDGTRLGMEQQQVDAMRSYGRTVAESLRALCEELGISWRDPATRRAAQRAVLTARDRLGFGNGSPSLVGPPLSEEERQRAQAAPRLAGG